jgi:hypothetical protein
VHRKVLRTTEHCGNVLAGAVFAQAPPQQLQRPQACQRAQSLRQRARAMQAELVVCQAEVREARERAARGRQPGDVIVVKRIAVQRQVLQALQRCELRPPVQLVCGVRGARSRAAEFQVRETHERTDTWRQRLVLVFAAAAG